MASIRQRDGRWQARVTRKGYPQQVRSFGTRGDAARWAREVELEMDRGAFRSQSDIDQQPLRAVLDRYLIQVTPLKRGAADEAIRIRALRRSALASHTLQTLTPAHVASFRDQRLREVAAGAVIRDLSLLSSVINHARREWGATTSNACQLVRRPQAPEGRSRVLTSGEEQKLLAALAPIGRRSPLMGPLVTLALETAMRRGELLALTWTQVDLDRQTASLVMTKNGTRRIVPLSRRAVDVLSKLQPCSQGSIIFPIKPAAVHKAFQRACARAGLTDLRFHDLRHSAATRMSEKLPNVLELAAVTGHRTVQMLKRYFHPDPAALAAKLG